MGEASFNLIEGEWGERQAHWGKGDAHGEGGGGGESIELGYGWNDMQSVGLKWVGADVGGGGGA